MVIKVIIGYKVRVAILLGISYHLSIEYKYLSGICGIEMKQTIKDSEEL